jgi:hypothetical protein
MPILSISASITAVTDSFIKGSHKLAIDTLDTDNPRRVALITAGVICNLSDIDDSSNYGGNVDRFIALLETL